MIYLASPYTHANHGIEERRYEAVASAAALLMSEGGLCVFSPIVHCHPLRRYAKLPGDWEFWQLYDRQMIEACTTFAVLMLEGWEDSKGLSHEGKIAKELGRYPYAVHPNMVLASIPALRESEMVKL